MVFDFAAGQSEIARKYFDSILDIEENLVVVHTTIYSRTNAHSREYESGGCTCVRALAESLLPRRAQRVADVPRGVNGEPVCVPGDVGARRGTAEHGCGSRLQSRPVADGTDRAEGGSPKSSWCEGCV